jgi:FemAB-related protein (PEP-CTERM system-associated)
MVRVELCQDPNAWDGYVESHAGAANYHRWCWRQVIEQTFGHEAHYFNALKEGALEGVLPLFSIRSRLFGNSLVSVPFFSYGGVLASSAEARVALLEKAEDLAKQLGARHIELRQGQVLDCRWKPTSTKVKMQMSLPSSADDLWKRFSTGLRNKIRKGQKSNFRIEWGGAEAVGSFYRVFSANMRNLGTPVYPRKWFEAICEHSPGKIHIMSLWDDDRIVASAFLSAYGETLELPWSASLPDTRKKYSHYLMYWTFMEWAIRNGFRLLDLGRCTTGSGTYEFKRHWVCEELPLEWYYWVAPGSELRKVNTDNPRYHFAIQVWKHLPLTVANQLGPRIVRGLP